MLLLLFRQVGIELEVLKQLQHECLVGFLFVADEGARISVFMDWAGNNLPEAMAEQPCAEELAQHITYQLTSGLAHLQQKVGHWTIHPAQSLAAHLCTSILQDGVQAVV